MKKKFSIILALVMFLCSVTTTYANTESVQIPNYIQEIIDIRFEDKEIVSVKNLLALENNVIGTLLTFSPTGYIAYNENDIFEMSTEASYPIDLNNDIYYFGPLQVYQKKNNSYVNLLSNESYISNELVSVNETFSETISNTTVACSAIEASESITPYAVVEGGLPYDTRVYTYNPDYRCGSLALAITLMYYDDHVDSYMVPNWIANADTTGEYFVNLLCPHIEELNTSYQGSKSGDVASGCNWYFRYRGVSDQYSAAITYGTTYSEYRSLIDADKPVMVLLNNNPTYNNHWVVGTGYYNQHTGNTSRQLIVVNDGWGAVGREINFSYVVNTVHING